LAENLRDAECFLGLHFAYPAPFIPGVEMIAHTGTDEAVVPAAESTLALAGKLCARVNDRAGFVLNRLQFVLLKEAANIVAEGVAKAEDIDAIVRTTFGFRLSCAPHLASGFRSSAHSPSLT
jgi:3-hydroxybutyryl-CoA dehydrogenase